jgi:hypothetical protein
MLIFDDDKGKLAEAKARLIEELGRERLRPHATKCRVHACREGIPFLGFRFWPDSVRVLRENRLRFEKRTMRQRRSCAAGRMKGSQAFESAHGWIQFAREFTASEGLVMSECRRHGFGLFVRHRRGRTGFCGAVPGTTIR